MFAEQLFTFVTVGAGGETQRRNAGRVGNEQRSRTHASLSSASPRHRPHQQDGSWGAAAQTVIVSVLESLRQHLPTFTLSTVIEEIGRWCENGRSCFARWAKKLRLLNRGLPNDGRLSLLDRLIPVPDG